MSLVQPLRPDALVLDMDGLLVDSEPLWHEVEQSVARAHGGSWTAELSRECIGTGLKKTARLMRERLGLGLSEDEAVGELGQAFVERVAELELKPGAAELLGAARGRVPLALASSSSSAIIEAVLGHFELLSLFDAVVSGLAVARAKPAPDIFLRAAELLGLSAARCVALEDSLAGVTSAKAAGMIVIAVPEHDGRPFGVLADYVVGDLHQALRLFAWQ
jgi:HAD superfamily hydrolase (TIGR01509 family)